MTQNNKSSVQDDRREIDLAALFNLRRGESRIDVDAYDVNNNPFELKTTSKGGVSTARDLGPNHIAKWKLRYWIIARGRNLEDGFVFDRYFFLAPQHMDGWYQTITDRFSIDIALTDKVMASIRHLDENDQQRAFYRLDRGMRLNDPNIPWRYVERNGIEITKDFGETLQSLVGQYPMTTSNNDVGK